MCGIFAAISLCGSPLPADTRERLSRALQAIKHRGPDATGIDCPNGGRIALGHVRLSVIDTSASADQPFWSECGRYGIAFNGEIYNYTELRHELEASGVRFRTQSDTEVLMQVMAKWGPAALNRLNGMWSFVFIDTATMRVLVSRDRWGVKPLYIARSAGTLLICSEAKGIIAYLGTCPPPNLESIGLYMKFGVGGEHDKSWFQGIDRFPSASFAEINLSSAVAQDLCPCRYWDYPRKRRVSASEDDVAEFRHLLEDAVRIRLRSDVPLGLSLSGGLDSASIAWLTSTACGKRLDTFTSWFRPKEMSELGAAQVIASKFGHHSYPIEQADSSQTLDLLQKCIYHLDGGHSSTALVPYMNLCRAARQHVTVVLEGQGADELLAGYSEFALHSAGDSIRNGRALKAFNAVRHYGFTRSWSRMPFEILRSISRPIYRLQSMRWGSHRLLGAQCDAAKATELSTITMDGHSLSRSLEESHRKCLTNLLQYGDAISMSVNLEARCPFLDYRLVEFCFRLPMDEIYNNGISKWILRAAASGSVPDQICWNRRKDGFTNPTTAALREITDHPESLRRGWDIAVSQGIFTKGNASLDALNRLPDNIYYRAVSVMLWADIFYGPGANVRSPRT
jgi:asparagine synthase (glutamine-hydrolysing)